MANQCVRLTTRAAISVHYFPFGRGAQTPGHPKTVRRPSSARRSGSLGLEG